MRTWCSYIVGDNDWVATKEEERFLKFPPSLPNCSSTDLIGNGVLQIWAKKKKPFILIFTLSLLLYQIQLCH